MKLRQAKGRRARCVITAWLAAVSLGLGASPALAQQAASATQRIPRVYFGAAGLFATQPGTSPGDASGDLPLEGSGLAFSGLFGAGGRLSVEGQVTRGPELTGIVNIHTPDGVATYTSTFRDTLVSAFVRYRGSESSRIQVQPVAGLTLAFGGGTNTHAFVPETTGIPGQFWDSTLKRRSLGFGGGLDLLVTAGRAVALGGMLRVHRFVWNEEHGLDVPNVGLGRWVFQAGAGVRLNLVAPHVGADNVQAARAAGERSSNGYVGGFGGLVIQPVGEVDGHYLTEGVGGNGFGLGGTVGAFIHPRWSVAAEVAVGPEFKAESTFAGRIRYNTRYRDTLISGLFRRHPARSSRVAVEPVFGATVAVGHAPRTETWLNWMGPPGNTTDATITRLSFGAVGGADIVAGGRLAAVASFRLHVLKRNDVRDGQPPELGVGRFAFLLAGGIRYTF